MKLHDLTLIEAIFAPSSEACMAAMLVILVEYQI
jgi:hypothetical protein